MLQISTRTLTVLIFMCYSVEIAERKDQVKKSEQQLQISREKMVEQVMVECDDSRLSFVCFEYADQLTGQEHVRSVACVGRFPLESDSQVTKLLACPVGSCFCERLT